MRGITLTNKQVLWQCRNSSASQVCGSSTSSWNNHSHITLKGKQPGKFTVTDKRVVRGLLQRVSNCQHNYDQLVTLLHQLWNLVWIRTKTVPTGTFLGGDTTSIGVHKLLGIYVWVQY